MSWPVRQLSRPLRFAALALLAFVAAPAPTLGSEWPAAAAALVSLAADFPRPAATWLEAQVELARRGFSGGPIDGLPGPQSAAAVRAFQRREGVPETGLLDAATQAVLRLDAPP